MSTEKTVIVEFSELLSNYYPGDTREEAVRMCYNYFTENEISMTIVTKILRRMGEDLMMFIIYEQRIKLPEVLYKSHDFRERRSLYK